MISYRNNEMRAIWASLLLALGCTPAKPQIGEDIAGPGDSSGQQDTGPGEDTGAGDCPAISLVQAPGPAQLLGVLDPLVVATGLPDGATLLIEGASGAALGGAVEAELRAGEAVFDAVEALAPGPLTLRVRAEGCAEDLEVGPLIVGRAMRFEPVFLPELRVGVETATATGWGAVATQGLPPGLTAADGWLTGVPEVPGATEFEAAAAEGEDVVRYGVQIAVFPSDDALDAAPFDPAEDGPYGAGSVELSIPSVDTSRGTYANVAVRVAFPAGEGGAPAEGPFPLIVFHHAAHSPATIYDDYTTLHGHWASHGYVVASVDSSVNVPISQSWQNLTDMSSFQLAAMQLLLDESADPDSALAGRVDPDRVFVSGHSRGGGASLISLWREPSLAGAICFEQVSPLQTPNQDWEDPEGNGDRLFPSRPVLFLAAGDDLDEPWPLPHSAYDQATGATVFVTLHGTNHEWTYDEGTAGGVTSASDISFEERHALDQAYSTAFLERFARADLRWEAALFGPESLSSSLSDRGVSVAAQRHLDSALLIDDFAADEGENLLGGANEARGLDEDENAAPYTDGLEEAGRGATQIARIDARTTARRLGWEDDAALRLWLTPDGEGLDLGDQRAVQLRVSAPCDPPPGDCDEVHPGLQIALIDADGEERAVDAAEGMGALGVVGRHWSQVSLPLDGFLPVDLSRIVAVELRFEGARAPDDALWVDDLRLE